METKKKHTVLSLSKAAKEGKKLVAVTAYNYPMAKYIERAGLDLILVGDSVGMVELGYSSTIPVTMDEMMHHCKAVRRGAPNTFVVGDMPFMSYHESDCVAIANAGRFIKEGCCDAVKLEWTECANQRIRAIVDAGMLVMAHVGFTPQRTAQLGGYRVQGRGDKLEQVVGQALELQEAGAFCVLLEMVPSDVGKAVSDALDVFTIGVGAGPHTAMQMVVLNDMLGLYDDFKPKYVRRYAELGTMALEALQKYAEDVREGRFPSQENFYD